MQLSLVSLRHTYVYTYIQYAYIQQYRALTLARRYVEIFSYLNEIATFPLLYALSARDAAFPLLINQRRNTSRR